MTYRSRGFYPTNDTPSYSIESVNLKFGEVQACTNHGTSTEIAARGRGGRVFFQLHVAYHISISQVSEI